MQGRVIHSEKGVWAEGRPVLGLSAQGDSRSLSTCPWGSLGASTERPNLNSQKQLPGGTGNRLPSSCRMWQRLRWQGWPRKERGHSPRGDSMAVRERFTEQRSSLLSSGEGPGLSLSPPERDRKRPGPGGPGSSQSGQSVTLGDARCCRHEATSADVGEAVGAQGAKRGPEKQSPRGTNAPAALLPFRERANSQSLAGKQQRSAVPTKRENLCKSSAFAGKEESGLLAAAACLSQGSKRRRERPTPERNVLRPDILSARERSVLASGVAALRKGASLSPRSRSLSVERVARRPGSTGEPLALQ